MATLLLNIKPEDTPSKAPHAPGVHAFEIVARILKDDRFSASALGLKPHEDPRLGLKLYEHTANTLATEFLRFAEEWLPEGANLDEKIEETSWMCALLYGVGGLRPSGEFTADFFEYVPPS